jgi:hypothetical protein
MNELIDDDCGLPVDVEDTTPMGWARRAKLSQEALEATLGTRNRSLERRLRRAGPGGA